MKYKEALRQRDKLAGSIGAPAEILRGSLFERTIRHKKGCRTCAEGGGHPAWILSVNYPGGRNKQISLRPDQKVRVELWLGEHSKKKEKKKRHFEIHNAFF